MIARSRIAFAASVIVAIAAVACGTIAELDVTYEGAGATVDGGGAIDSSPAEAGPGAVIIRDSSFAPPDAAPPVLDPSDAGPCEPDSDDGGGCDFSQGLGCCLLPLGASRCIFQWEIAAKCSGGLFVGCRGDDPSTESACCWRDGPPGSNSRMSVLSTSCDGGAHACRPEAGLGCATGTCSAQTCTLTVGAFDVGTCGGSLSCP